MSFDLQKFLSTSFIPRAEDVAVPELKAFFADSATPLWKVRGLNGEEVARAIEAVNRNRNLSALAEGLLSPDQQGKTEALRKLLGIGDSVTDDLAKRLDQLVSGSVEPKIDHEAAVKLAEAQPVVFFRLTNKILELTGLGSEPGKPKRSSGTRTSDSPSPSAT